MLWMMGDCARAILFPSGSADGFGQRRRLQFQSLDLANNRQISHNGEQRRRADKNEYIVERTGLLNQISNNYRRCNSGQIANEVEQSSVEANHSLW